MIKFLRKHYDRLIDTGFWPYLLLSISPIARMSGLHSYQTSGWMAVVSASLHILCWLLLLIAVVARPLRDEYAERLWQKAAAWFVYVLVLCPVFLVIVAFSFDSTVAPIIKATPVENTIFGGNEKWGAAYQQYEALLKMLVLTTAYTPLIFAALYKWHRWRGSQ